MSRLKVLLRGALISEIQLNPEKEYIGGRKEGSDIRLQAEKGISREHFRLKFSDGHWQVQAVSRFGDVFSLGQKVEQAQLDHGQTFQIPPYEFHLLDVPESDVPSDSDSPAIEVDENERTVIGAAPQVPYIKMVNATGEVREMLRLEVGDLWVAGRDPSCQIIIPDQRVSRRQFEIHKVSGFYTILDLASVNGTFLNSSPISSTDPQTLKSGDVISVLDNTMYFELHDPNFKYKVEKIEIPQMQINSLEDELPAAEGEELIEEISEQPAAGEEYQFPAEAPEMNQGYDQQGYDQGYQQQGYDPQGGPFTGMPPGGDPNQYYGFAPPDQPPPQTPMQKFLSNKPLVAIVALVFLGAVFYLTNEPEPEKKAEVVANDADPFSRLSPAQQKEVKEYYAIAEQMQAQQKWDLVIEKIGKIHAILPAGYKDSKRIQTEAEQSLLTIVQQQKDEQAAKEERERQEKIIEIAAKCEKLLTPQVTVDEMSTCLTPIAAIDPTNVEYVRLSSAAEKIATDRKAKEDAAKEYQAQIDDLKSLFKKAEKIQSDGFAFKAMKAYEAVLKSTLPDPTKLKDKAKARITFIEEKISEKSTGGISLADAYIQEGKLKAAVIALRETLVYDPENKKIKEKIDTYSQELRRQARAIYQESIIDESYGVVDSTPDKLGAKDKWKKITELDLEDGEYYRKAVIKLRRYGIY